MSDDRLKELLRQRALLAEHLAWLDREIAGAQPLGGAVATPASVTNPSAVRNVPVPAVGQPRPLQPTASAPATDVDALFDRLQTEEKSRGQFSKQGCWLVFAILMVIGLVGIAALVFSVTAEAGDRIRPPRPLATALRAQVPATPGNRRHGSRSSAGLMDLTFAADPLAPLRQLYRQAYLSSLTREEGAEPSSLHAAWRDQLAQLAPIDATELDRMMTEERRRVDEARVLAELLLPQLLSAESMPRGVAETARRPLTTTLSKPAAPTPIADPSGAATPAVADLLDAMLRQDSSRSKRNDNAA